MDRASAQRATQDTGLIGRVADQFALRQLISEYMIPVETNTLWYTLGGVLAIALVLEIATGCVLALRYIPDASRAYAITAELIHSRWWHVVLGFHYFNAYLIFGLVMVHMMRVFLSGGYRRGKQGLWLVGAVLAGLVFIASLTGESLHFDEVGFAVPWHISEFFQAIHLADRLPYTFADLKSLGGATARLEQLYVVHIAIAPLLIGAFVAMHYYLIRAKGISLPFWHAASGIRTPFSEHIRAWLIYGGAILLVVLLLAMFVPRGAGVAAQVVPDSPLFGSTEGPGELGAKPSFPISWTHGMNIFVGEHLGIEPDIWGTVAGMALMTLGIVAVPFLDRRGDEPRTWREAFDWRRRGWAFGAIALFWLVMVIGVLQNAIAGPG